MVTPFNLRNSSCIEHSFILIEKGYAKNSVVDGSLRGNDYKETRMHNSISYLAKEDLPLLTSLGSST